MDALAFLSRPPATIGSLYVLHGDEAFLKRQALKTIRGLALGPEADDQGVSTYAGDTATFAQVFDELDTVPFFEPRRLVVVDNADPFVTRYRADLEKKVGSLPATGTLVLDVKAWAATTRLAKLVDNSATLVCKAPKDFKMPQWCGEWALAQYEKQLPASAASLLVEHVGLEMGQLDQELSKLSVYVGAKKRIEPADVDRLVGNSRAQNTWKIFDAIAAGNVPEAMTILHRLFDQGENAFQLAGAFNMQLRRLALAARLTRRGSSLGAALEQVGVHTFGVKNAEAQVRHLGRRRLAKLYDWLLELNMDLRGNSPLAERTLFERFLLKLAPPLSSVR